MRRSILILLLIVAVSLLAQSRKPRVGVLPFTAKGISAAEASIAGDIFRGDIVDSGVFEILDRNNMEKIMKEQEFQQSGCTESSCAVQLGKLLNMEYMIYGSVSKLGETLFLQIEIINIETSQIVQTSREEFNRIDRASDASKRIIEGLKRKIAASEPAKPFDIRPVLWISAGSCAAAGITMNTLGILQWSSMLNAESKYNATSVPSLAAQYYTDRENSRTLMSIFNIIGYSSYAVAAGLATWALLAPPPVPISKKKTAMVVVPYFAADNVGCIVAMQF